MNAVNSHLAEKKNRALKTEMNEKAIFTDIANDVGLARRGGKASGAISKCIFCSTQKNAFAFEF